jgi:hypothetical protein
MHQNDCRKARRVRLPSDSTRSRRDSPKTVVSYKRRLLISWEHHQMQASNKVISMERRSKVRYPLRTPVSYRTLDGLALTGEGEAVDMSSAGIEAMDRR